MSSEIFPGFWGRLKDFVSNVQVNDAMGEEEKEMILHICKQQSTPPHPVQSDRGVEEVLRAIHQNTQGPRYWPAIKLALGNYTSLKTKIIPSIDDAGVIAANISESIKPKLTEHEQAFFIAGFQECIKYLNYNQ